MSITCDDSFWEAGKFILGLELPVLMILRLLQRITGTGQKIESRPFKGCIYS